MADAILFVIGASGVGKTAAVQSLMMHPHVTTACFSFDAIGVPDPAQMDRNFGGPEGWQAQATQQWIARLVTTEAPIAILEGQTRPSFIQAGLKGYDHVRSDIVLLDCRSEVRRHRLNVLRGQRDLATAQMECWAAYLRGQADALGLTVIDTSDIGVGAVAELVRACAQQLAGPEKHVRSIQNQD